jgi:TPP-dependent pyruvate/acetoin dehydrogenase alpha subunit
MDVEAVAAAARRATDAIRAGGGPHFLELRTFRFRAHSMFDPERYRDKSEVAEWQERDPIQTYAARLRAEGLLDDAALAALEEDVAAEVQGAVDFAEAGTDEPVEELTRFVYSERVTT